MEFFNWSLKAEDPAYDRCSPNLTLVKQFLGTRFGMWNNGCYAERDIRGGSIPSAHSHGAAIDQNYPDRVSAKSQIIPFLIDNSDELGIQAIHDYVGSRIWRAGRTKNPADAHTIWWKPNTTAAGMGDPNAKYLHIETTKTDWGRITAISVRLGTTDPVPEPIPPSGAAVFTRTIKPGDEGADVAFVQTVWRAPGAATGDKTIVVDGRNGPITVARTKLVQQASGLTADGIIGPKTQAVVMRLANT